MRLLFAFSALLITASCSRPELQIEEPRAPVVEAPGKRIHNGLYSSNGEYAIFAIKGDVFVLGPGYFDRLQVGTWRGIAGNYRAQSVSVGTQFFTITFAPISSSYDPYVVRCLIADLSCDYYEHERWASSGRLIDDSTYLFFSLTQESSGMNRMKSNGFVQTPPKDVLYFGRLAAFDYDRQEEYPVMLCDDPSRRLSVGGAPLMQMGEGLEISFFASEFYWVTMDGVVTVNSIHRSGRRAHMKLLNQSSIDEYCMSDLVVNENSPRRDNTPIKKSRQDEDATLAEYIHLGTDLGVSQTSEYLLSPDQKRLIELRWTRGDANPPEKVSYEHRLDKLIVE